MHPIRKPTARSAAAPKKHIPSSDRLSNIERTSGQPPRITSPSCCLWSARLNRLVAKNPTPAESSLSAAIYTAIRCGNIDRLFELLHCESIDINSKVSGRDESKTPLCLAVGKADIEAVCLLRQHGARVTDVELQIALDKNDEPLVAWLTAEVEAPEHALESASLPRVNDDDLAPFDDHGNTRLHLLVEAVLDEDDKQVKNGETQLRTFVESTNRAGSQLKELVNAVNLDGDTPLHIAVRQRYQNRYFKAQEKYLVIMRQLCRFGADPTIENFRPVSVRSSVGEAPLDLAGDNIQVLKIFADFGCKEAEKKIALIEEKNRKAEQAKKQTVSEWPWDYQKFGQPPSG